MGPRRPIGGPQPANGGGVRVSLFQIIQDRPKNQRFEMDPILSVGTGGLNFLFADSLDAIMIIIVVVIGLAFLVVASGIDVSAPTIVAIFTFLGTVTGSLIGNLVR